MFQISWGEGAAIFPIIDGADENDLDPPRHVTDAYPRHSVGRRSSRGGGKSKQAL